MTRFEIAPYGDMWSFDVNYDDGKGYRDLFHFKFMAVFVARRLAHKTATHEKPVSLRIKDRKGRYQEERTYPRSADPRRTPG